MQCKQHLTYHLISFHDARIPSRIFRYHNALKEQPKSDLINPMLAKPLAIALFVVGQTFVITSTWALGITGKPSNIGALIIAHVFKALFWEITLASSCLHG